MHYYLHSGAGVPNLLKPFLVGEMVAGGIGKERNEESQASKNSKCYESKTAPCCPSSVCGGGLGCRSLCRAKRQLLSAVSQRLLADKIPTLGQHSEIWILSHVFKYFFLHLFAVPSLFRSFGVTFTYTHIHESLFSGSPVHYKVVVRIAN